MLIIKIDNVHAEAPQTAFARFAHVIRLSANSAELRLFRIAQDSELRRDNNVFAMSL